MQLQAQRLGVDKTTLTTYVPQIVHGQTTEQQIREWFGTPVVETKTARGYTHLVYLTTPTGTRLDIYIDEKGRVFDHYFGP